MSGIHTPAIDPDSLLSQDPQYIYYVKALVAAKGKYNKSRSLADGEEVKMLRYKASMENINIYDLEHDVFVVLNNRQPTEAEKEAIAPYVHEVYLMHEMMDVRQRYAKTTDSELRKRLHQEAQFIRLQVHGMGLDAYRFEERTFLIYEGKPMTAEQKKGQFAYVDEAIKTWDTHVTTPEAKKDLQTPYYEEWESYKKRIDHTKMNLGNRYSETYSGADMVVFMAFPGHKPIEVGVASTVSYTTYREKKQVRTLGRVSAKGITKGSRTISGRLIFTIIREHIVEMLRKEIPYLRNLKTILMDELPPFDILVSFGNEYGGSAGLVIQGITTVDEQKTLSIEDLFTENLFTFIARALEPMRDMNNLDREYDPLEWFTTSFNAPGSEGVANFKPKELQLYKDAELLADPSPFYGSIAGWDATTYDWGKLAENLGIDGSLMDSYEAKPPSNGAANAIPDMEDKPGIDDNVLFVQVAAVDKNRWILIPNGKVHVLDGASGKKLGEANITYYTQKQLYDMGGKSFDTYPMTSNMNTQGFPMRMSLGNEENLNVPNVYGAIFKKINYTKGKDIVVTFIPSGSDYNSKTIWHRVNDDQSAVVVKTEKKGQPSAPGAPGSSTTKIVRFDVKGTNDGTRAYTYWEQDKPKKSRNGNGTISADVKKSVVFSRDMAETITVQVVTEAGEILKNHPITVSWRLDLSRCDTVDNVLDPFDNKDVAKYNAIDKKLGLVSTTAMPAVGNDTGTFSVKTDPSRDTSTIRIPKDKFYTISTKKKKLYWSDLPKNAMVIWTMKVYPPGLTNPKPSDVAAYISFAFIKDAS